MDCHVIADDDAMDLRFLYSLVRHYFVACSRQSMSGSVMAHARLPAAVAFAVSFAARVVDRATRVQPLLRRRQLLGQRRHLRHERAVVCHGRLLQVCIEEAAQPALAAAGHRAGDQLVRARQAVLRKHVPLRQRQAAAVVGARHRRSWAGQDCR